jgi:hypothetical protein
VHTGEIRWNGEDFAAGTQFVQRLKQVRPHLFGRHFGCWAAGVEEKAHISDLTPGLALDRRFWIGANSWGDFADLGGLQKKLCSGPAGLFDVLWAFLGAVLENVGVY